MEKATINEKIQEIARRAADKFSLELVRAEIIGSAKQRSVRIFIDKPAGVTHEDCSAVSREIGDRLDEDDSLDNEYILEVSSPGLERELYSSKDFEKFTGSLAKVKTRFPVDGQRNFKGRIRGVENGEIVFDDKTNGETRFSFEAVAKANLEIDIEEEFKRGGKPA